MVARERIKPCAVGESALPVRLMREASLIGDAAGHTVECRILGALLASQNILLNQPAPTGLNQQWVADLIYIGGGAMSGDTWRLYSMCIRET